MTIVSVVGGFRSGAMGNHGTVRLRSSCTRRQRHRRGNRYAVKATTHICTLIVDRVGPGWPGSGVREAEIEVLVLIIHDGVRVWLLAGGAEIARDGRSHHVRTCCSRQTFDEDVCPLANPQRYDFPDVNLC